MPDATPNARAITLVAALLSVALLTGGCSTAKLPGVYRLDIQQGNVITPEMLAQLELGMDRRKVRFILGTPLLTDTFNQDRWDYLYSLEAAGSDRVQRHVTLFFENDQLVRIEGDLEGAPIPESARPRSETIVTVPAERRKKGFFSWLVPDALSRDRAPSAVAADSAAETSAAESTAAQADSATTSGPVSLNADDSARLEELFEGYGKIDGETRAESAPPAEIARESASP